MSMFRSAFSSALETVGRVNLQVVKTPCNRKRMVRFWTSHSMRASWTVCLGAALIGLSGCAASRAHPDSQVDLDKTPVVSIKARLSEGLEISPGTQSQLIVLASEPDGEVLFTEGTAGKNISWKDLTVTASIVTVNQKGMVSLADDPRISDGKEPHVTITVRSRPDIRTDLDIPVTYDHAFNADFSGKPGSPGGDGVDGANAPGVPGDPIASNGSDGGDGKDGKPGGDAPSVEVRMSLRPGNKPLLQVSVSAAGRQKLYLVDPDGGSLTVNANGGPGGSGGKGGLGSSGTRRGQSGSSGRSGSAGADGKGGSITVTYDPQAKPFLKVLRFSNLGGPAPVFNEQQVAPLW
jgi:hypothetical protein